MRDFKFTESERPTMANFNARFDAIAALANGIGNEYVWEKSEISYSAGFSDTLSNSISIFSGNSVATGSLTLYNSLEYVNGSYQLKDVYKTFNLTMNSVHTQLSKDVLNVGEKYFSLNGIIYKTIPGTSHGTYGGANPDFTATMEDCYRYIGVLTNYNKVDYVNSPDPNAYPPAESDGYTYTLLGQFGDKVRIETGSYVGTGTYGSSNPNSLTFEFVPQVLFIVGKPASWNAFMPSIGQIINNKTSEYCVVGFSYGSGSNASAGGTGTAKILYGMFDNKKITWYANSENIQLNISNVTYEYIAIG